MSEIESRKTTGVAFECVTPILPVRDLAASIDHYLRVLGFKLNFQQPGVFASVSRGPATLFLSEGDQGHSGAWVWIGVHDAAALFEEYRSAGATIRHEPTNYPWAYEMQVQDPDGNILRLGSEPYPDRPIGEWLDMKGQRWRPEPGGGWTRVED
ncbi:MAG: VOC family protein [Terriglobales bacterium]